MVKENKKVLVELHHPHHFIKKKKKKEQSYASLLAGEVFYFKNHTSPKQTSTVWYQTWWKLSPSCFFSICKASCDA